MDSNTKDLLTLLLNFLLQNAVKKQEGKKKSTAALAEKKDENVQETVLGKVQQDEDGERK